MSFNFQMKNFVHLLPVYIMAKAEFYKYLESCAQKSGKKKKKFSDELFVQYFHSFDPKMFDKMERIKG